MANSYHKGSSPSAPPETASALLIHIDSFIRTCRTPALLERGEQVVPLTAGEYLLEIRSERLWIDVWHENRSFSRRILSIEGRTTGVLDCCIHRFGGVPGKLSILDLDRPQTKVRALSGSRQSFGEQFRRMLGRQLPGWELRSLSAAMDLQRSFSPLFPRALLTKGQHQIAAMVCPNSHQEGSFLTFATLWLAHVRQRANRKILSTALHLFLPEDAGSLTAHRLRWLSAQETGAKLYRFNAHGSAGEVDPDDLGNLDTAVKSRYKPPHLPPEIQDLVHRLLLRKGLGICPELSGAVSISFQGMEFARLEDGRVSLGIESKELIPYGSFARVEQFADQLQLLVPELTPQPERWLEAAVRSQITALDADLRHDPVHSQVLSLSGRNRDSIDLLAASHAGRLAVIELKAVEDIHLPMQALDYWMRVAWHARRSELDHLFPAVPLLSTPPRLLLVAPALSFHSANQTVLRYFSPEIDVERIGINSDWQAGLRIVLRLHCGEQPQSHQTSHDHSKPVPYKEGDRQPES